MGTSDYMLRITLSSFLGAYVRDMENENGEEEQYLCIPLRRNGLAPWKDNSVSVFMTMGLPKGPLRGGWTHTIKMRASKCARDLVKSMGLSFPVMGKARPDTAAWSGGNYVRRIDDDK